MSGFDFTLLLQEASQQTYHYINVKKEDLVFLIKKGNGELAQKINRLLEDTPDGKAIKLLRFNDLTVKERLGLRNDRFNDARRKELIAYIGQELRCSAVAAEDVFKEQKDWVKLSEDLRIKLGNYFLSVMAEQSEETLPARRISTIIQERLDNSWKYEWTIELPESILEQFVAYFEGEASKWASEKKEGYPLEDEGKSTGTTQTSGQNSIEPPLAA